MESPRNDEKRIIDSCLDPAIVVGGEGEILYWNRAFAAYLGVRSRRIERDPECHLWLNLSGLKGTIARAREEKRTIRLREVHGTLPDGSPCSVYLSATPLCGDGEECHRKNGGAREMGHGRRLARKA